MFSFNNVIIASLQHGLAVYIVSTDRQRTKPVSLQRARGRPGGRLSVSSPDHASERLDDTPTLQ